MLPRVPQAHSGGPVEQRHFLRVPAETHRLLHLQVGAGGSGGVQERIADAQRDNLFDAVVFDVMHRRFDRRARLQHDVLRPDTEDQRAIISRRTGGYGAVIG